MTRIISRAGTGIDDISDPDDDNLKAVTDKNERNNKIWTNNNIALPVETQARHSIP